MTRRVVAATMLAALVGLTAAGRPAAAAPADADLPDYLKDRGTGVPTSMFNTYIRRGEWIVYPFFEYYRDKDFEYKPSEFGFTGETDYRGRFRASEGLIFVGRGITDDLAIEVEASVIRASLDKAPGDVSLLPQTTKESGVGDVEGQIRWRWARETKGRPEFFSYGEWVLPHARTKALIGTADWEFKLGTGMIKGFSWGTMVLRGAVEYNLSSQSRWDLGEYAVEYLKRVSPKWRVYAGLEGLQDEISLITEAQWHFKPNAFLRLNNGVGLTSKATGWSPEVGVVFIVPARGTK